MIDLNTVSWSMLNLAPALEALAQAAGLNPALAHELPSFPERLQPGLKPEDLNAKMAEVGEHLGLEVEPVYVPYVEVYDLVRRSHPAILCCEVNGETRFLALLKRGHKRVKVIDPDLQEVWVSIETVVNAVCEPLEKPHRQAVKALLEASEVPISRRKRAQRALLQERLGSSQIKGCWLLRMSPGSAFLQQLVRGGVITRFLLMIGVYSLQYVAVIFGWWLIGRGALSGLVDLGWVWAWILLMYSEIPLNLLVRYSEGMIGIGVGGLLKKRLLFGALRLDSEAVRRMGAGQLLSRVLEAETIEATALEGGFSAVLMVVELMIAGFILSTGAGGLLILWLLMFWLVVAFLVCRHHYVQRQDWTDQRLEMTHELIEKMVGHRTRLAQESRASWHFTEDRDLRDYLDTSQKMDRSTAWMNAVLVRGWMVLGTTGIGIAFVSGDATRTGLAIALGGVILARNGFANLSAGFTLMTIAAVAWQRIKPLFEAAQVNNKAASMPLPPAPKSGLILEAHNLGFQYNLDRLPILSACDLEIYQGDRLLLQGASGAGKSTLGSLLTGLRQPNSGLLLYRGLDRKSLGSRTWRKMVVAAPQFHENHVFTETFLFNLLMGRGWPPNADDTKLAVTICQELGLGQLLERMPGGVLQMVGETGWQLSHGECSRLFIARTLLQSADLVVLDESFAALDPENLSRAMNCVYKYARSLLVIAHP